MLAQLIAPSGEVTLLTDEEYETTIKVLRRSEAKTRNPQLLDLPSLAELDDYSDEELEDLLKEPPNPAHRQHLEELTLLNKMRPLTEAEKAKLTQRLAYETQVTLIRSKTFALLSERGYDITSYFVYPK